MNDIGKAYRNQAMELIAICRLFSQAAEQVFTQDAEFSKVLEVCDKALKGAADARKEKYRASDDDIERAIRKLQDYGKKFHASSSINNVKERMKKAKERDEKEKKPPKPQRSEDPSLKVILFYIMKNLTDSQPIIVRQVLNNDSKLQEVLWNFSRFSPDRRLTLSQSPHFYHHLPTAPNANWPEFDTKATDENWHSYHTQPIYVLTNAPGRVFFEVGQTPRAFDNFWHMNETIIFKSVSGKLEGASVVGASIQDDACSWCHVEPLSSEPGAEAAVDPPNSDDPSVTTTSSTKSSVCVPVTDWHDALRRALHSPDVKIRIIKCIEPARGCVRSD